MQIAKALGAKVTVVASTGKLQLLRDFGIDHTIDYTRAYFSRDGQRYDLIFGVNGYRSLADHRRALDPQGTYVMTGGSGRQIFEPLVMDPLVSRRSGQTVTSMVAGSSASQARSPL
ncbi:MAG: zinc-binding dehydrogenase [Chloroflexi bacterium]|nr:zinc-binding dehydrogenase [Chloroflexota bacterium]